VLGEAEGMVMSWAEPAVRRKGTVQSIVGSCVVKGIDDVKSSLDSYDDEEI
jgi:hypothetical protein